MSDMSINGLEGAGRASPADLAASGASPAVTTDARAAPRPAAVSRVSKNA